MLRRGWLRGELVVVLATAALGACGTGSAINAGTAAGPSGSGPSGTTAAQPYRLYTHCGIDEARIGNRYFEAVHPLSNGHGNPPRAGEIRSSRAP
jgi:hypothetical protein